MGIYLVLKVATATIGVLQVPYSMDTCLSRARSYTSDYNHLLIRHPEIKQAFHVRLGDMRAECIISAYPPPCDSCVPDRR